MSLSSTTNRVSASGNGTTTVFSFPYYFLVNADLVVKIRTNSTGAEVTKTITTHYTVSGAGEAAGGSVTMLTAPTSLETIIIYRDPAKTQDLDLVENDPLPAEELEKRFDKAMMIAQRLSERADRSVGLKEAYIATFDPTLPATITADTALVFNSAGDGFTTGPTTSSISGANASAVAAAASAAAALVSEGAAATSASGASTSASTATTQASNASTSASNAATSETNAATSEANASTSASTATTQASNASTSAATATTQASNASTSASTATTQASNASTSATNAATSASNAATSETNAAASAAAAAASAASVATPTYQAKTANYTLVSADTHVGFDTASGNLTATLPTAASVSGEVHTITKQTADTNTVTIATTSSQTIGGRASSHIVLRRRNDSVTVRSNGTNWVYENKRETEILTAAASAAFSAAGGAGRFLTLACSVALRTGRWRLRGEFGLNIGSGTTIGILTDSGFFNADGANSTSIPTALGGTVTGDSTFVNANSAYTALPLGSSASTRIPGGTIELFVEITSDQTVYLVPKIDHATVGTAAVYGKILAERIV